MPAFVNQQEGDGQENLSSCIWKPSEKADNRLHIFPAMAAAAAKTRALS